jgi:CheY-like chemotaxis protein/HPt (histidine-containing phosphotransfer) domain-containing protein
MGTAGKQGGLGKQGLFCKPLILIAEDSPVNQTLFALILDKLGYPVVLANDGIDALEKAAANPVALVFMDIQMPRMNGYKAAEELRRRGFRKPVIAVTASALADERERCMQVGFDDILAKPFKRQDIEKKLLAWIDAPGGPEWGNPAAAGLPAVDDPSLIFNPQDLSDTFMDDTEMAKSMLTRFLDHTGRQIAREIPKSMEAEDWETAMREAHTIKGSALTMSGRELGEAAARLERAFKTVDRAGMAAALPPLTAAFTRFKAAACAYIKEGGGLTGPSGLTSPHGLVSPHTP